MTKVVDNFDIYVTNSLHFSHSDVSFVGLLFMLDFSNLFQIIFEIYSIRNVMFKIVKPPVQMGLKNNSNLIRVNS